VTPEVEFANELWAPMTVEERARAIVIRGLRKLRRYQLQYYIPSFDTKLLLMESLPEEIEEIGSGSTWEDAERAFPGSSVQWDVQDGPAWAAGRLPLIIVVTARSLSVGCGFTEPYGWALWDHRHERWLFM